MIGHEWFEFDGERGQLIGWCTRCGCLGMTQDDGTEEAPFWYVLPLGMPEAELGEKAQPGSWWNVEKPMCPADLADTNPRERMAAVSRLASECSRPAPKLEEHTFTRASELRKLARMWRRNAESFRLLPGGGALAALLKACAEDVEGELPALPALDRAPSERDYYPTPAEGQSADVRRVVEILERCGLETGIRAGTEKHKVWEILESLIGDLALGWHGAGLPAGVEVRPATEAEQLEALQQASLPFSIRADEVPRAPADPRSGGWEAVDPKGPIER